MIATAWDGVGPKRDCLLLVKRPGSHPEWMHFQWRDADAEMDGEGNWDGNPDEYHNEDDSVTISESSDGWMGRSGKFDDITGDYFSITHWAEVPEVQS